MECQREPLASNGGSLQCRRLQPRIFVLVGVEVAFDTILKQAGD